MMYITPPFSLQSRHQLRNSVEVCTGSIERRRKIFHDGRLLAIRPYIPHCCYKNGKKIVQQQICVKMDIADFIKS